MKEQKYLRIAGIVLLSIIIILLTFFIIKNIFAYLLPFIIAMILAGVLEPLIGMFERKLKLKRGLAVSIALVIIISIFTALIFFGTSRLFFELDRLLKNIPDFKEIWKTVETFLDKGIHFEYFERWNIPPILQGALEDSLETIYKSTESALKSIFQALQDGARWVVNIFINLLIVFLATYFISKDKNEIGVFFNKIIPERYKEDYYFFKSELLAGALGYVRARVIMVAISTFVIVIGLEVFGSPYSLILGLACGILDLIPVVGPGFILLPWAVYLFILGNKVFALKLIALYLGSSVLRTLLEPKIIGESIGVHPLAMLFSIYLGIKLFGGLGIIVGPALVIAIKAFTRTGIFTELKSKK